MQKLPMLRLWSSIRMIIFFTQTLTFWKLPWYPLALIITCSPTMYVYVATSWLFGCNNLENFHSFWHFFIMEYYFLFSVGNFDSGGGRGKTNGGCLKGCSNIGSNVWKITKIWSWKTGCSLPVIWARTIVGEKRGALCPECSSLLW